MRKAVLPVVTLLLLLPQAAAAGAQETAPDPEREAVRKVVETYLFSEETGETKETFLQGARIVFVDHEGKRARVEPVSRGGGRRDRGKPGRVLKKILAIDVVGDGASVKVETVLSPDTPEALRHEQYLWLLKTGAGWRIAGILMPTVRPAAER